MEKAPFYNDVAQGPDGGSAYWLRADDGVRIRLGVWPEGDQGTVLIFPGRTEYVEKYGHAAKEFAACGFATIAIDWRGQGLAERLLPVRDIGHVGDFDDYQTDVRAVMDALDHLNLPKPYYLVAHSMGGCIGLRALYNDLNVDRVVFSAPMWGIQLGPMRPVAWALSSVMPQVGLGELRAPSTSPVTYVLEAEFDDNTLTTDQGMWDYMRTQVRTYSDLALGGPSVRWINLALREMAGLARQKPLNHACLTFLGTNERIVSAERIKSRMATWPSGRLEILERGEHETMMERPELRDRFYQMSCAHFMGKRATEAA